MQQLLGLHIEEVLRRCRSARGPPLRACLHCAAHALLGSAASECVMTSCPAGYLLHLSPRRAEEVQAVRQGEQAGACPSGHRGHRRCQVCVS